MIAAALGKNIEVIRTEAERAQMIVPCWGAIAWDPVWVHVVLQGACTGRELHCLGKTASGAPTHPMARGKHRVPDTAQPQIWRRA